MPSDTYHWLAKYFDHMFEYQRPIPAARKRILGPLMPGVKTALDLCCGTGELAMKWAAAGIEAYAVDLSPEMCRIARGKARKAGLRVHVQLSDMRAFRLPREVDLVTCEFDAINHLPRKGDLKQVLRSVAGALRPGGHFFFDTNNRKAFETAWRATWFVEKDPVAMVMRSGHKDGTDKAWCDVHWFIRKGRTWARRLEHVEEVCWSAAEIRAALESAGFDKVRAWDAAPFFNDRLTRPGCRTFWLARKAA